MNRLVPYLDLFCRLPDVELAKLAGSNVSLVQAMRERIMQVNRRLEDYVDLLPRLSDEELARLTGLGPRTILFWRRCQPKIAVTPRKDAPRMPEARVADAPIPNAPANVTPANDAPTATTPVPTHATAGTIVAQPAAAVAEPREHPKTAQTNDQRDIAPKVIVAAKTESNAPRSQDQGAVSAMMSITGAPFPGYAHRRALAEDDASHDDEVDQVLAPLDAVTVGEELSLDDIETMHGVLDLQAIEGDDA